MTLMELRDDCDEAKPYGNLVIRDAYALQTQLTNEVFTQVATCSERYYIAEPQFDTSIINPWLTERNFLVLSDLSGVFWIGMFKEHIDTTTIELQLLAKCVEKSMVTELDSTVRIEVDGSNEYLLEQDATGAWIETNNMINSYCPPDWFVGELFECQEQLLPLEL